MSVAFCPRGIRTARLRHTERRWNQARDAEGQPESRRVMSRAGTTGATIVHKLQAHAMRSHFGRTDISRAATSPFAMCACNVYGKNVTGDWRPLQRRRTQIATTVTLTRRGRDAGAGILGQCAPMASARLYRPRSARRPSPSSDRTAFSRLIAHASVADSPPAGSAHRPDRLPARRYGTACP